jgi:hypothetical protein
MRVSPCGTMVATRTTHLRLYNAKSGQQLRSIFLEEKDGLNDNLSPFPLTAAALRLPRLVVSKSGICFLESQWGAVRSLRPR